MIYLDNAATTKMSETCKNAMLPFFDEIYGNASSLHTAGQIAKEHLENAREKIAKCLNAKTSEIYFTSGGSESDNWAITNCAYLGLKSGKKHIITSAFEHHAVLHTLKNLEKQGFSVTYLPVYNNGIVKVSDLTNAITNETCLVTIMFANNEIGTIQPIKEIGEICKEHNIPFHTDAVQAVGHVNINVEELNINLLSLSAHKFNGPKGVGVLYCKSSTPLKNLIFGGGQERTKRAGTENLPAIVGMATSLEESLKNLDETNKKQKELRDLLFAELSKIPHSKINGDLKQRLSNNFNMSFEGIEGESLLLLLDDKGICASSGSACTSGSLDPSHVLLSIGLIHEIAHGSLRLSLSPETTKEEILYTIDAVKEVVQKLRDMSPIWNKLLKGEKNYVIQ